MEISNVRGFIHSFLKAIHRRLFPDGVPRAKALHHIANEGHASFDSRKSALSIQTQASLLKNIRPGCQDLKIVFK